MDGHGFEAEQVAVVTGAALGIGRATCKAFAGKGMKVCLVDLPSDDLDAALEEVRAASTNAENVIAVATDVADLNAMQALKVVVERDLGPVNVLMNNAVTRIGPGFWDDMELWRQAVDVNLWGVINGVRTFIPDMISAGSRGCIINSGSKQGITNPPGNTVYNLCKAAIKSYTESLAHQLRNSQGAQLSAHLLIPGWTTTGKKEHKPGAWLPQQVVERMISSVCNGDFYIVCPDNEVTEEMDQKRILWSAGDVTENRPALSRWHGGFDSAFDAFEP